MASLPILIAPDPRLKKPAVAVERVDDEIRHLMDGMLEAMYAANGIGLAAPQIGVSQRIVVLDIAPPDGPAQPMRLVNPEILWRSDDAVSGEEGCLSLPDQYADVSRPSRVRLRYLDHENELRELEAVGLLAKCVQHEIDHLDGVLFVDHVSAVKRNIILRKLAKAKKSGALAPA
ncbi:MAG: peptide deformylase [Rhodospirillales bacterium]|nr:peptide deformylase [Rhodospirillales bacterium]